MSRGLGKRQREIMAALEAAPDNRLPIHVFCDLGDDVRDDYRNQNEYAKVRSAIRGLETRGLVWTFRDLDPKRQVRNYDGFRKTMSTRAWSGTWVALSHSSDVEASRHGSGRAS